MHQVVVLVTPNDMNTKQEAFGRALDFVYKAIGRIKHKYTGNSGMGATVANNKQHNEHSCAYCVKACSLLQCYNTNLEIVIDLPITKVTRTDRNCVPRQPK